MKDPMSYVDRLFRRPIKQPISGPKPQPIVQVKPAVAVTTLSQQQRDQEWQNRPFVYDQEDQNGRCVHVWNRRHIEWGILKPNPESSVLISIHGPGNPVLRPREWHPAVVLDLVFDDVSAPIEPEPIIPKDVVVGVTPNGNVSPNAKVRWSRAYGPITAEQAKRAVRFVLRNRERTIHVHCDAGVSRSVAMGFMVAQWLNRPLKLHSYRHIDSANRAVMQEMARAIFEHQRKGVV